MQREILTYPLAQEQIWGELLFVIEYFLNKKINVCHVLFGFAWGNEYYPGNEWNEEEISIDKLSNKVREMEKRGIGYLGSDDLFIKLPAMELLFCNDSDIHIRFLESNDDVEYFYSRWKLLGYKPAEWVKSGTDEKKQRVRFN